MTAVRAATPVVLAAFLALGALPARADEGRDACRADAAALCPKAPRGHARLQCLRAQQARLSKACAAHLDEERSEGEAFRQDCKADIGGSCLGLQGRGLIECLEGLGPRLSPSCAGRLSALRADRRAVHESIPAGCRDDAQRLCAGVASGGVAACLRAHGGALSAACRAGLK